MNFGKFKILYKKFSVNPLPTEYFVSEEYHNYVQSINKNQEFQDWIYLQIFDEEKFNYKDYCCLSIAYEVSKSLDENGDTIYEENIIINKLENGTFGIPIHRDSELVQEIKFCPWCGSNLKKENEQKR
ncbi:MAG: hypothetical protein AB8B78_11050 [Polaribacter sp.]